MWEKNLVVKSKTGEEGELSYYPECSIQILLHPINISNSVVREGFFRRFLFIQPKIEISEECFLKRIYGVYSPQSFNTLLDYLKDLKNWRPINPVLSPSPIMLEHTWSVESTKRFYELHRLLRKFGEGYSKKISEYMTIIRMPLQDLFLKMVTILAGSQKKIEISTGVVEMAFVDLLEFLNSNFKFVEERIQGSLGYGDEGQPIGDDLKMIEWLTSQGALSLDTSKISIKMYQDKMGVPPDIARNRYRKHIDKGWIKMKKSSHDSRVWVVIHLDEENVSKISNVMAEYQKIIDSNSSKVDEENDLLLFEEVGRMIRM
jgi:hypothetical protein